MWAVALAFFLAALYQAGRAEYYKRRAADPWETAWRDFQKQHNLALRRRHPSVFDQDATA